MDESDDGSVGAFVASVPNSELTDRLKPAMRGQVGSVPAARRDNRARFTVGADEDGIVLARMNNGPHVYRPQRDTRSTSSNASSEENPGEGQRIPTQEPPLLRLSEEPLLKPAAFYNFGPNFEGRDRLAVPPLRAVARQPPVTLSRQPSVTLSHQPSVTLSRQPSVNLRPPMREPPVKEVPVREAPVPSPRARDGLPSPPSPVPTKESTVLPVAASLIKGGSLAEKPSRVEQLFSRTAQNATTRRRHLEGSYKGGRSAGNFDAVSAVTARGSSKKKWYQSALIVFLLDFTGFMPKYQITFRKRVVTRFVDGVLRGIGQVVFCENPISGLAIIVACLVQSPWLCMTSVVGVVSSTSTALLLGLDSGSTDSGLQGFNGYLVGGAVATFMDHTWQSAVLVIPLCAGVCFVHNALRRVFEVFQVPAFTLPFIIVYLMFHLSTLGLSHFKSTFPSPYLIAIGAGAKPAVFDDLFTADHLLRAFASGVGQIFFCDSWISGVIVLGGMLICSPILCCVCLLGSIVGTLTGIMVGATQASLSFGLWGYNAALGAIAVVAFFVPTVTCVVYATFAAWFCALVGAAFSSFLAPNGCPSLTFGFVLGVQPFMLIAEMTPVVVHVRELWKDGKEVWEAGGFSPPEWHLKLYRSQAKPISPLLSILTGLHPAVIMSQVGTRKNRLPDRMLTRLLRHTNYSEKELNDRFQLFLQTFPKGEIHPADLEKLYQRVFPLGRASDFSNLLFKRFDVDGSGHVTFEEYITTLSLIAHGTLEDRLGWIFNLYGGDENGQVSRDDIIRVLHAVYTLLEDSGVLLPEAPVQYAEDFFRKATTEDMMAESFGLDEFLNALMDDEELQASLRVYDKI